MSDYLWTSTKKPTVTALGSEGRTLLGISDFVDLINVASITGVNAPTAVSAPRSLNVEYCKDASLPLAPEKIACRGGAKQDDMLTAFGAAIVSYNILALTTLKNPPLGPHSKRHEYVKILTQNNSSGFSFDARMSPTRSNKA